jgi:hypothetical protein
VWLSKGDHLIFYSVLERDINAVDAYASIDHDDQEFCEIKSSVRCGFLTRLPQRKYATMLFDKIIIHLLY